MPPVTNRGGEFNPRAHHFKEREPPTEEQKRKSGPNIRTTRAQNSEKGNPSRKRQPGITKGQKSSAKKGC